MTPEHLRAEAEKVALEIVTTEFLMEMGRSHYQDGYNFDMQRELQAKMADALVAFADRHGARELEGQI